MSKRYYMLMKYRNNPSFTRNLYRLEQTVLIYAEYGVVWFELKIKRKIDEV